MQKINTDYIAQAYGKANLQNVREAAALLVHGRSEGFNTTEIVAAAVRFGYMQGRRESKEKIRELHQRIHQQEKTGDTLTDPAEVRRLVDTLSSWIDDPSKLREATAYLAGRAAALEADALTPESSEDDPAAADQHGDTENDVNTPTEKKGGLTIWHSIPTKSTRPSRRKK